ncbi:unnamed protein product [Coffea canephora]|uniref:Uncharacterized protein n=1 Tax=Coffea canephora TaxID=49390 RepID=A0A068V0E4_COFCA|nr:unnamed protein product [Coffea canephora]
MVLLGLQLIFSLWVGGGGRMGLSDCSSWGGGGGVVDLTAIHGPNYVVISSKARRDFLLAVQQIAGLKFSNPVERRFVTELAMTLQQMWGKCS